MAEAVVGLAMTTPLERAEQVAHQAEEAGAAAAVLMIAVATVDWAQAAKLGFGHIR